MRNSLRDTRAQPISNLQANPVPSTAAIWTSAGSAHTTTFTTNSLGMRCFKVTQNTTGTTAIYASRATGGFGTIRAGEKYTFLCWVEADFNGLLQVVAGSDAGPQVIASTRLEFAVQANTPQFIRHTFTIPTGAFSYAHFKVISPSTNPSTAAYSVAKIMVVAGEYTGPYSDGNTPGWKWNGAAGTNTSTGWPYTLESIAGKPAVTRATYGTTPYAHASGAAVTLLSVYAINTMPTTGWDSFGQIQTAGGASIATLERRNASPFTQGWVRSNTVTANQLSIVTTDGATIGRHVLGGVFDSIVPRVRAIQDGTLYAADWNGSTANAAGVNYYLPPPFSEDRTVPLFGIVYSRALTNAELSGVSRWLANAYGCPPPQGETW